MASDRMQIKSALDAAVNVGFISEIYSLHSTHYSDKLNLGKADSCLVTKMNQSVAAANLAALALLKNERAKIIVQYCDNMFDQNSTNTKTMIWPASIKCIRYCRYVTFSCEKG